MTDLRWDAWHGTLEDDVTAADPWYRLVLHHLPREGLGTGRMLEIGCGRGGFACHVAAKSPRPREIVAMDFSTVALEKAKELARRTGARGITWRRGDIQAIDEPDAAFDVVVSCETIEHVQRPQKAIRELARVLKPGGRLYLTSPNYLGPLGIYRIYLRLRGRRYTEVGQPINQFTTLPQTAWWVKSAGLRIDAVDGVGHYSIWPGREPRRIRGLDVGILTPVALHSLVVASKPA